MHVEVSLLLLLLANFLIFDCGTCIMCVHVDVTSTSKPKSVKKASESDGNKVRASVLPGA